MSHKRYFILTTIIYKKYSVIKQRAFGHVINNAKLLPRYLWQSILITRHRNVSPSKTAFHSRINLIPLRSPYTISKRSVYKAIAETSVRVALCNPPVSRVPLRAAALTVHKPDPAKMTHEECQNNEIIGQKKPIQHPLIAITKCQDPQCDTKRCDTPCDPTKKPIAIAHVTHSEKPPGKHVSNTNLKGEPRAQYGRFYSADKRTEVSEPATTLDTNATKELNDNKDMRDTIHLYEKFHRS